MAELIERLRKKLAEEYGITTDEQLIKAVEEMEELDISVFVMPYKETSYEA